MGLWGRVLGVLGRGGGVGLSERSSIGLFDSLCTLVDGGRTIDHRVYTMNAIGLGPAQTTG